VAATRLIFLGPPGSGKGTQAQRLTDKFGLCAMSSGDTLRREIQAGTEIGKQAVSFVSAGKLVPDNVITGVMLAGIARVGPTQGFILDGFPRTLPQAESLTQGLTKLSMKIDAVIDFQMPDQAVVDRIVSRRVCSKCGFTYNVKFSPPRVDGVCDRCGGQVNQRTDDTEAVIRTRLEVYRTQTAPLRDYYLARRLLLAVDASLPTDAVTRQMLRIIDPSGAV